jgi:hypothetical protein
MFDDESFIVSAFCAEMTREGTVEENDFFNDPSLSAQPFPPNFCHQFGGYGFACLAADVAKRHDPSDLTHSLLKGRIMLRRARFVEGIVMAWAVVLASPAMAQ